MLRLTARSNTYQQTLADGRLQDMSQQEANVQKDNDAGIQDCVSRLFPYLADFLNSGWITAEDVRLFALAAEEYQSGFEAKVDAYATLCVLRDNLSVDDMARAPDGSRKPAFLAAMDALATFKALETRGAQLSARLVDRLAIIQEKVAVGFTQAEASLMAQEAAEAPSLGRALNLTEEPAGKANSRADFIKSLCFAQPNFIKPQN